LRAFIGSVIDRVVFKNENGHGIAYFVIVFVCEMVLGILASTIVMWFSRYREFKADAGGAALTDRTSMINALRALQREQLQQTEMPDSLLAFGINSARLSGFKKYFASHPPLDDRIAALKIYS